MFKVWLSLSLLCRFDDRCWTRQARRVPKNSGERELSAAYYRRVCFDFWLEMARGCGSGVNFGPRFVTHEDRRARKNWRDPTERLGGPAVNAGRILTDRPSAFVLRRDCQSSAERRKREARQTQHAEHIGAAVGRAAVETCIALVVTTALGGRNVWVGRRATAGEGRENPKKVS